MLVFTWAPFNLVPFVFIAFLPVFFIIEKGTFKQGVFSVWLCFVIWGIGSFYWISNIDGPFVFKFLVYLGHLVIPFKLTLPFLLFLSFKSKFLIQRFWWALLPFFVVAFEFLEAKWDLALPITNLGYGLSSFPILIQFNEYTGVAGGTFLVVLCNVLFYLILTNPGYRIKILSGTIVFLLCLLCFNWYLYVRSKNSVKQDSIEFAVIQPNLNSYEKHTTQTLENRISFLDSILTKTDLENVDLVVCPENYLTAVNTSPLVINHDVNRAFYFKMDSLCKKFNISLLSGFEGVKLLRRKREKGVMTRMNNSGDHFNIYNGALFFDALSGRSPQLYIKNNLVPFIESPPFRFLFSTYNKIPFGLGNLGKGFSEKKPQLIKHNDYTISTLICFESVFPDYLTTFHKGSSFIAVLSNEEWANSRIAQEQMGLCHVPLALSFRKSVIRCSNSGASLLVCPDGKIDELLGFNKLGSGIGKVIRTDANTFYSRNGNLLGMFSLLIVISVFVKRFFTNMDKQLKK